MGVQVCTLADCAIGAVGATKCNLDRPADPERKLRVAVWVGATPSMDVCTHCSRRFRAALTAMPEAAAAEESLQAQFAEHKCVDLTSL